MAKRKRDRLDSEVKPTAINVDWPVFVPNGDGSTDIEVGRARLRYGTLVVEFKDSAPSMAIQNMISRGVLLGFGMIMLKPDVVNNMYQEVVADEEARAAAQEKGIEAGLLRLDEDGKVYATADDQTAEEVIHVLMNLDQIVIEKPVEANNFQIVSQGDELDQILNTHDNKENS